MNTADVAKKIEQSRAAGYSDDEIVDFLKSKKLGGNIEAASGAGYSSAEILDELSPKTTAGSAIKQAASGVVETVTGIPSMLARGADALGKYVNSPEDEARRQEMKAVVDRDAPTNMRRMTEALSEALPAPRTDAERYIRAGASALPMGVLAMPKAISKTAGAVSGIASGVGSEAAGDLTEGTGYEIPARVAGGMAGGVAGLSAAQRAMNALSARRAAAAAERSATAAEAPPVEDAGQSLASRVGGAAWQGVKDYGLTGLVLDAIIPGAGVGKAVIKSTAKNIAKTITDNASGAKAADEAASLATTRERLQAEMEARIRSAPQSVPVTKTVPPEAGAPSARPGMPWGEVPPNWEAPRVPSTVAREYAEPMAEPPRGFAARLNKAVRDTNEEARQAMPVEAKAQQALAALRLMNAELEAARTRMNTPFAPQAVPDSALPPRAAPQPAPVAPPAPPVTPPAAPMPSPAPVAPAAPVAAAEGDAIPQFLIDAARARSKVAPQPPKPAPAPAPMQAPAPQPVAALPDDPLDIRNTPFYRPMPSKVVKKDGEVKVETKPALQEAAAANERDSVVAALDRYHDNAQASKAFTSEDGRRSISLQSSSVSGLAPDAAYREMLAVHKARGGTTAPRLGQEEVTKLHGLSADLSEVTGLPADALFGHLTRMSSNAAAVKFRDALRRYSYRDEDQINSVFSDSRLDSIWKKKPSPSSPRAKKRKS